MSLIHWWPLTNNLVDYITSISLNNYSIPIIRDGKLGSAYSFTGIQNTRLQTPYQKTLSNQEFSIALWLRLHATQSSTYKQIFTIGNSGTSWAVQRATIFTSNNKIYFTLSNGSNYIGINGPHSETLEVNKWYHITAIFKDSTAYLYINGKPAEETPFYTINYLPKFDNANYIYIGGNSTQVGKCDINDVRIYNHALSLLEIKTLNQALMFHYSFNFPNTQLIANETGLSSPTTISAITLVSQQNLPIGNYCGKFNGSQSRILFPIGKNKFFTNDYTISFWAYPLTTEQAVYFGDQQLANGNKFNFERYVGDDGEGFTMKYNGSAVPGTENIKELKTPTGEWTMISITYTDSTLTFYKNGEKKTSIKNFIPEVDKNYTDNMEIGRGGRTDTAFNGYMSDFRLYSSALSDQEIKELYNCGGRISNLGDALTGSFVEDSSAIKINKNHTIETNEIIEQDEAKTSFKKDGTIFARQIIEI